MYPTWEGSSIMNIGRFCVRRSEITYEPINAKTICPALIFAASRNDKVAGRTTVLIVSASVRKGFNQAGAPSGRRAAVNEEMLCFAELIIKASHKGRPNESVNRRCLDEGRTKGINPVQFVIIRNKNKGDTSEDIPLIDFPRVRDI